MNTPWTVQHLAWVTDGSTDAHGNIVGDFAAPVDLPVYGWGAPQSDEPRPDGVTVDLKLYIPAGFEASHRDRFVLPSGVYGVVGKVEDYSRGPFEWAPGVVVNLQRVEG